MPSVPSNSSPITSSFFLKNEASSITDIARGKSSGTIASSKTTWPPPPEGSDSATGSQYESELLLKGQWQGSQPSAQDLAPSELRLNLSEKNHAFELSQKLQVVFDAPPNTRANSSQEQTVAFTAKQVNMEFDMLWKDAEGQARLEIQQKESMQGQTLSHATQTTITATEALQISGIFEVDNQNNSTQGLTFDFSPTAEDQTVNLTGDIHQSQSPEDCSQGLSSSLTTDNLSIQYSREATTQREHIDTITMVQAQEALGLTYDIHDISLELTQQTSRTSRPGYNAQGQVFSALDQTRSREIGLQYAWSQNTKFGLLHSQEVTSASDMPENIEKAELYRVNIQHQFNPQWSGEASYTLKPRQSQLWRGKVTYEEKDDLVIQPVKWQLQMDRERNFINPHQSNTHYQFAYSARKLQDDSLAMDCKFSYATYADPQLTPNKWDSTIRIYGDGKNMLPLETVVEASSDRPPSISLNIYGEF